jgi:hypothetical protein
MTTMTPILGKNIGKGQEEPKTVSTPGSRMRKITQLWECFLFPLKRPGTVAQVVECLPNKLKAPSTSLLAFKKKKKGNARPATVAHTCNPSYLGGREQEDRSLRPTCMGGN